MKPPSSIRIFKSTGMAKIPMKPTPQASATSWIKYYRIRNIPTASKTASRNTHQLTALRFLQLIRLKPSLTITNREKQVLIVSPSKIQ